MEAGRCRRSAERFALPDVVSDLLNTRGAALNAAGQPGIPTMRRALEVALAADCDEQVGRAYTNLYGALVGAGRIAEGERTYLEAIAFCRRLSGSGPRWCG